MTIESSQDAPASQETDEASALLIGKIGSDKILIFKRSPKMALLLKILETLEQIRDKLP